MGRIARTISQRELRNDNAEVIRAVTGGETFIVTRNGTPVADLRPMEVHRPRFVTRTALVQAARTGPHLDARQFRADLDQVDQRL
ncbi:MAG: hypothetical protein NVS3B12_33150 [Acidimicrobiales bacterium]